MSSCAALAGGVTAACLEVVGVLPHVNPENRGDTQGRRRVLRVVREGVGMDARRTLRAVLRDCEGAAHLACRFRCLCALKRGAGNPTWLAVVPTTSLSAALS